jgi:inorganic pyrophosphatase
VPGADIGTQKLELDQSSDTLNVLTNITPYAQDGFVNALIEIPAGTIDKWELNKSSGKLEWESINGKPRKVNYIGYPGNYGMIPSTLLSKESGGDGDPLDILVLGPSTPRGSIVKCKIIGVLYLLDRGERDDKLIAISADSPLVDINNINELEYSYHGVLEIVKLWFENYKGHDLIKSPGYGNKTKAIDILKDAIEQYKIH